jgi:hypothetical protein
MEGPVVDSEKDPIADHHGRNGGSRRRKCPPKDPLFDIQGLEMSGLGRYQEKSGRTIDEMRKKRASTSDPGFLDQGEGQGRRSEAGRGTAASGLEK